MHIPYYSILYLCNAVYALLQAEKEMAAAKKAKVKAAKDEKAKDEKANEEAKAQMAEAKAQMVEAKAQMAEAEVAAASAKEKAAGADAKAAAETAEHEVESTAAAKWVEHTITHNRATPQLRLLVTLDSWYGGVSRVDFHEMWVTYAGRIVF